MKASRFNLIFTDDDGMVRTANVKAYSVTLAGWEEMRFFVHRKFFTHKCAESGLWRVSHESGLGIPKSSERTRKASIASAIATLNGLRARFGKAKVKDRLMNDPRSANPPITNNVYRLCEAVADLATNFAVSKTVPEDSREMTRLCIEWAQEFEKINEGREWDGEYIEEIDDFFEKKHAEWRSMENDKRTNWRFYK